MQLTVDTHGNTGLANPHACSKRVLFSPKLASQVNCKEMEPYESRQQIEFLTFNLQHLSLKCDQPSGELSVLVCL